MQQIECLVCKKQNDDVQNYRDDFNVEPKLMLAHPEFRNLNYNNVSK